MSDSATRQGGAMERSSILGHLVLANETIKEARNHVGDAAMREDDKDRRAELMDIRNEMYELQVRLQRYADGVSSW